MTMILNHRQTSNHAEYLIFETRLRERYVATGIQHYFLDGPVTDAYWSSKPRVAVLNLEAYGYEKCAEVRLDINIIGDWMKATGGKIKTKTTRYTAVFLAGLIKALETKSQVSPEALKNCYSDLPRLMAAMSQIAYVNIRKTSNSVSTQDVKSIKREATGEGLSLLQEQFRILDPELIIVGGLLGCDAANGIFEMRGNLRFEGCQSLINGSRILSVRHFSRIKYTRMSAAIDLVAEIPPIRAP